MLSQMGLMVIFALSYNMLMGQAGLLSFGHAVFFGLGGYATIHFLNYAAKENGAHFKGKCFVFDDRLAVAVDPNEREPISRCEISGVPCDTYLNCANMECNKLFLCAKDAAMVMEGCCSDACKNATAKRPFDPENIYLPYRKWYNYFSAKLKMSREPEAAQ